MGLLIFLGIEAADTSEDIEWLSAKIAKLRIFDDEDGVMNLSLLDLNAETMVISQFTLHAKTKKGNRPSYIHASTADHAEPLYQLFMQKMTSLSNRELQSGEFGAHMDVELVNNGPVTIWIDTKNKE
jgi:D-tyrosyl-tRNA(Tyr) deacylase